MTRFWAFRLFERILRGVQPPTHEPTTILRGGRLLQQLVVDCWASAEQLKLRWIRTNQGSIRADLYQGLVDALQSDDLDASHIGHCIVLPSSFTGSDRHMSQLYQDSMAVARKYGPATYFITVTANPHWEEIQSALLPSQQANDCPELVSRVFHRKLTLLLKHLKKVFGKQLGQVHVIEFQKRGLPHSHILLWVAPEYKPHTAEALDKVGILPTPNCQSIELTISPKVISAKIPDPHRRRLYELVTSQMIHHCSPQRCLDQNGKCRKGFPKAFCEETSMDDNRYPTYARPQNGNIHRITHQNDQGQQQDIIFTNQHVVPYNPHLTLLLGCHVNVEFCANLLGSIKYIHKYISKGPDRATIFVSADGAADEIRHYEDCRYIGPHEAIWRILHFSMHGLTPNVYRLQLHLKGEHYVYFNPEGGLEAAVHQGRNVRTMLEAFYIVS